MDIPLTLGELEKSVTVTGEAPMLQTDRTDTGRIIPNDDSGRLTQGHVPELDFPTELFLSSAFADEPFPDLLLAKSFGDQLDPRFTE